MYGGWLYFETPDCALVSLDAKTGKERWYKQLAPVEEDYFCSSAPLVVGNHVMAGMGGDARDIQGKLEAHDPETGDVQWTWYTTPQNPGDPGYDTWPDDYSRKHGGAGPWQPLTYDPDLNLIYVSTGNPNPVGATQSRKGDNLFTCSIVALNPDTGKMAWYYQTSPHDAHDWDSTEAPVLFDAPWQGKPRKLVAQAARNGYFFVLDRATGEHLLTAPLVDPAVPQLGLGHQCERAADQQSQEGIERGWRTGGRGFGDELASAEFLPADRTVLCGHKRRFQHELPRGYHRPARRLRLYRRRRWRERRTFRHTGH